MKKDSGKVDVFSGGLAVNKEEADQSGKIALVEKHCRTVEEWLAMPQPPMFSVDRLLDCSALNDE